MLPAGTHPLLSPANEEIVSGPYSATAVRCCGRTSEGHCGCLLLAPLSLFRQRSSALPKNPLPTIKKAMTYFDGLAEDPPAAGRPSVAASRISS